MARSATRYRPSDVSPPGETLLELLEERGLTQADLSARMERPAKTINEIVRGKARITPETALQLESTLGTPASFWLAREAQYQEWLARGAQSTDLALDASWLDEIPVKQMKRLGWIAGVGAASETVRECLQFFGVASVSAWREEYERPLAAFRTSTKLRSEPGAVAAWLRRGEIVASAMRCSPFDAARFRDSLLRIRRLTCETAPERFLPSLQSMCCEAGVAVVVEPAPSGCRASGVTRWLSPETAMLALSVRHKSDDHLWFTFFHEAGHLLLHSKKAVFVEEDGGNEKEMEANRFASDALVPPEAASELPSLKTLVDVSTFARRLGIAPGIVVGRLQHDGLLPWQTPLNRLKVRFRWSQDRD